MVQWGLLIGIALIVYYTFFKLRERKMKRQIAKENERLSLIIRTSNVQFCTYNVETQHFVTIDSSGNPERSYSLIEFSHRFEPSDFNEVTQALQNIIDGKQATATLQVREYDNDLIHYNNYTAYMTVLRRDKQNKPSIIIISKSDTSQDRMRQEQTKESMLRYQSLFNSALIDMVYYDADGYISDMNNKSLELTKIDIEMIRKQR